MTRKAARHDDQQPRLWDDEPTAEGTQQSQPLQSQPLQSQPLQSQPLQSQPLQNSEIHQPAQIGPAGASEEPIWGEPIWEEPSGEEPQWEEPSWEEIPDDAYDQMSAGAPEDGGGYGGGYEDGGYGGGYEDGMYAEGMYGEGAALADGSWDPAWARFFQYGERAAWQQSREQQLAILGERPANVGPELPWPPPEFAQRFTRAPAKRSQPPRAI